MASSSIMGTYRYAAVAPDAAPCASVGTDMMAREGGSAVDAAIATVLCTCLYSAHSCGIGGGHFMTIYSRERQTVDTIIAREMAPSGASEEMYLKPGASSTKGGLAIGVPGQIMGMWEAHKRHGILPWRKLFDPAIKKCEEGIHVTHSLAGAIREKYEGAKNTPLGALLTNDATKVGYKAGEVMRRPKLAKTLRRIALEGASALYSGSLSADIAADIQDQGGIITTADLAAYTALVKPPLMVILADESVVYSPPLPSSGAVYLYILNILRGFNINEQSISTTEKSVETYHRIIEAFKFAYAKRSSLGDEEFVDVTELISNMTSKKFGDHIRSMITDRTHDTDYYGPTFYDQTKPGTSHMSLLAPNGDAVSITTTINLYFGSKVYGTRTGIIFDNEMDDFSTPNTTNSYGVPSSASNFIRPGKRPLSSMCPAIVVNKDGDVTLVVGASGGTRITTAVAEVTIGSLWFNQTIKEAIDYPRIHHQLLPKMLYVQKGFPQIVVSGLEDRGHAVSIRNSASSVVQGIRQRHLGAVFANSDYRKGGAPDGF